MWHRLAVVAILVLPAAAGAWVLFLPLPEAWQSGEELEPDLFESEFEAYDWRAIAQGDWVEYEVATASVFDESSRVRTRLACVRVDGGTAWVEQRDHIIARFFPGSVVLCEVERSSGRISRSWWGPAGGIGKPMNVRRGPPHAAMERLERRARGEPATVSFGGNALPCVRATLQERAPNAPWSSRTTVWLAPAIPFPRRASVMAPDDWITWEGSTCRGGVAREEFTGNAVRMTTEIAGWGKDARPTLRVK